MPSDPPSASEASVSVPIAPVPSGVSPRAAAAAARILRPLEQFLHVEASSGVVLLATAAVALALASSRFAGDYHRAMDATIGVTFASHAIAAPARVWINDGLMTVFFFVVGLEIRRETHRGELSTLKRAALPLAAALGGMLAPALLYAAINVSSPATLRGWGVPMATDIAFAVGILALLGKRVPPALRVLLLALAVIDDVGSILVIAVFYSAGVHWEGFAIAAAGVALTVALQRFGARRTSVYVLPAVVVWVGIHRAGIHPTLAGVIMGLLTPADAWYGPEGFIVAARDAAARVSRGLSDDDDGGSGTVSDATISLERSRLLTAQREAQSPAARLQSELHPWVAFVIMPLFAFANAGVSVAPTEGSPVTLSLVSVGVVVGLVVGKPLGILLASYAARRLGLASFPVGIHFRQMLVLGLVAGVGFTMAIFIAQLAFTGGARLDEAKLAILAASALAGILGITAGRALLRA